MSMQILAKVPSPKDPGIISDWKNPEVFKKKKKKSAAWIREFFQRLILG